MASHDLLQDGGGRTRTAAAATFLCKQVHRARREKGRPRRLSNTFFWAKLRENWITGVGEGDLGDEHRNGYGHTQ